MLCLAENNMFVINCERFFETMKYLNRGLLVG